MLLQKGLVFHDDLLPIEEGVEALLHGVYGRSDYGGMSEKRIQTHEIC